MKFIIKKYIIQDVLSKIQGLTSHKTSLTIVENVLIKNINSDICFMATDLQTGFEGIYKADIQEEGTIIINAKKLYEIVRDFPEENILFNEVENRWIEIGNDNVLFHIAGMNPDDFPEIPKFEEIFFYKIEEEIFKKMIERMIIISVLGDEKRAHLIGIYSEIIKDDNDSKILRMVSTDGSRLSKVDYFFNKDDNIPLIKDIIIPKKGINEALKFLDSDGKIEIGFIENHCILKKDQEIITIRLLEGSFPEYHDIIKKENGKDIEFDKYLFNMMLKRMSILLSEGYNSVIFSFENNQLLITSTNPEFGESKEEMEINFPEGKVEIAFNPKFFMDTFNVIDDAKVILNIVDEEHPCLVQGENDEQFISVIMPMRI